MLKLRDNKINKVYEVFDSTIDSEIASVIIVKEVKDGSKDLHWIREPRKEFDKRYTLIEDQA